MQTTIQYIKSELKEIYPESEIQGLTKIILEWVTGWNYTTQQINRQNKLNDDVQQKISLVIERLKKHEPIQYIIGETEFYGLKIKVTPSVLIPRPETEELVQWILEGKNKKDFGILDIGTGSGCIALALKSQIKDANVVGVDISISALELAKQNAAINQLMVDFFKADILKWENYDWGTYDIIVSNPPYVRESEKLLMHENVLEHEPESALFVADIDPLIFYKRIAEFAKQNLSRNGQLFFEINENLHKEMYELLNLLGFRNIAVKCDINGKKRMICCGK